MEHLTRIQKIERKRGAGQWYVGLPAALVQSLELEKGEQVFWTIIDKKHLVLKRISVPPDPVTLVEVELTAQEKISELAKEAREKGMFRQLGREMKHSKKWLEKLEKEWEK